jgi:ATP-dependent Clp protease protease subunit
MTLRPLPAPQALAAPEGLTWDPPADALERWAAAPLAAASDDQASISIFDVIGEDLWTGGGFTAKKMAGILRGIGPKDVTVQINSPGGDVFEGLAIYNLLREHPAKVSVQVLGIAASIASVIAMAGDEIAMGMGSFLMVHNAWGVVVGNRNDMRAAADTFDKFDQALTDIYVARTGMAEKAIAAMMDAETFIPAGEAIAKGFADRTMADPVPAEGTSARADLSARRRLDAILARQGMTRAERRRLMREATGTRDAAETAKPSAGFDPAAIRQLIETLRS